MENAAFSIVEIVSSHIRLVGIVSHAETATAIKLSQQFIPIQQMRKTIPLELDPSIDKGAVVWGH
jgi:hypothetical protein